MKPDVRRRLERLASEVGLCPRCLEEEKRDAEVSALAQRIRQNLQRHLAEREPDDLREQAQRLLEEADALEVPQAQAALGGQADPTAPPGAHAPRDERREEALGDRP